MSKKASPSLLTHRDFIATEQTGGPGEAGELEVWDAVKGAFSGRECLAYLYYPIFEGGAARA